MHQQIHPVRLCPCLDVEAIGHPLFVHVAEDDHNFQKRLLAASGDEEAERTSIIGALLQSPSFNLALSSAPSLFVKVATVNVNCQRNDLSDSSLLHVTHFFLQHYCLSADRSYFFHIVSCVNLTKVVIVATTPEAYAWASSPTWSQELVVGVCNETTLCRMGDVMLVSPFSFHGKGQDDHRQILNTVCVECEPVQQGLLTVCTNVVVVSASNLKNNEQGKQHASLTDDSLTKNDKTLSTYIHLVDYTGHLLLPGLVHNRLLRTNSVALKSFAASLVLKKALKKCFRIQILPKFPEAFVRLLFNDLTTLADPLNSVFITQEAMDKLDLKNGSWIKVHIVKHDSKHGSSDCHHLHKNDSFSLESCSLTASFNESFKSFHEEEREVTVISLDGAKIAYKLFCSVFGSGDEDVAFVSPHLWFHLNHHPSTLIQPETRLVISSAACFENHPPYASAFHLALVQCPSYSTTTDYSDLLTKYFSIPRYVRKGDIIPLFSRDDPNYQQKNEDPVNISCPIIYFKVTQITGSQEASGYLCDKENSRLYKAGMTTGYIPVTMETYYSPVPVHVVWNSPIPPGIGCYVEKLQTLIFPFLNSEVLRKRIVPAFLLSGSTGSGKSFIIKALSRCLNMSAYQVTCQDLVGESTSATEARIKNALHKCFNYYPCIIHLRNIEALGKEKEVGLEGGDPRVLHTFIEVLRSLNVTGDHPVVILATTSNPQLLSAEIASVFLHHIQVEYPDEGQRAAILEALLSSCLTSNAIDISYLAQRTAGFALGDLNALVIQATKTAFERLQSSLFSEVDESDLCLAGVFLLQSDMIEALDYLQGLHAKSIGAPKIPNVRWEDVGGLGDIKQEIMNTIQLPLQHPELLAAGLKRSGLLLYGPPGTGKTLLAKAVATECSLNFLSVKGPELINMYVGQSEENVREVFQRARSASPCVIFFDELDSLAPNRGKSGDSGGVMDRVVSQLLAEMDGLSKSTDVFVIGATNRPDLLDPAILRPGRFDQLLYVGIPEDKESQENILKALTRKFNLQEDFDHKRVIEMCSSNLTGADFYSLCSNAMMLSIKHHIQAMEKGEVSPDSVEVKVSLSDFEAALQSLTPSVSTIELEHYKSIQAKMN